MTARKITAAEVSHRKIDQAARWGRPQRVVDTDQQRAAALLVLPRCAQEEPEPEPVDVSRALGTRLPESWEAELITEARLAERQRERRMFDGVRPEGRPLV